MLSIKSFISLVFITVFTLNVEAQTKGSVLIQNVRIVTAEAKLSKPVSLLIENERIRNIGSRHFAAERVIDGKGQYLIPGLIDTHVHLRDVPGLTLQENDPEAEKINQQALAQIPKSYLYAGFTTLLDLANTGEAIAKWNSQPLAPQAYFCSPVLIPKGYPIAYMPEAVQQLPDVSRHYLHDSHSHTAANMANVEQHSPAKLVESGKKEGASCIKVFYEKGFGGKKNLPTPSETVVRELVALAHQHHMPVFLHGNSFESYKFGLATGVDMMVHGLWNADANTNNADLIGIANQLVKSRIAVQPTVQVIYGEQEIFNPDFFKHVDLQHEMPGSLIQWYQSDAGQWMKNEMSGYFKNEKPVTATQQYQQVRSVYQPMLERIKIVSNQLKKSEQLLVFGSDTPSGPFYTQFPGFNGRQEMNRWLDMGISLPQLFKAMTIGNAKLIGLENEIGSIEKGKQADLLLLGKNPLEDITAYDSISWVILKGNPIERDKLSALNR
jgi:imidazolonepropionase-like amidohydrolase